MMDIGKELTMMKGVVKEGEGKDWWADKQLWNNRVKKVEESGGGLRELALGYCDDYLIKYGEKINTRFASKYGKEYDPEDIPGYQPNSAWGGGYGDEEMLFELKGIRGENDLLPIDQAVDTQYGMSQEIAEVMDAANLDECRVILKRINSRYDIQEVDEIVEGDPSIRAWGGLDTILVVRGNSFEELLPTIVHEVTHKYFDNMRDNLYSKTSGIGDGLSEYLNLGNKLKHIGDEDIARLNAIRVCLKKFEETQEPIFIEELIDSAKFYNWHCFGRVEGK
ncbi:MAG TPA: hypothetical protein VN174_02555 [Candidatus Methanoperedens sp.]|nr:hypothetical protein [Candidatus Methanoperedens sp.]